MSLSAKRINGVLAIGLWASMVAGCSGGAGVGTSTLPQSRNPVLMAQSTKSARGNVRFAIGIKPKAKTGRITPQYVSPSTQSLQILTDGADPVIVNLTPTSPNCSPNPQQTGAYICTAAITVPTGNHVFTVTTYDVTGAGGNVLSTNSTGVVFAQPTGTTTVSIVLEGVVQYAVLTLALTNPPIGAASAIGVTVILEDADGNLIFGPAPFLNPVTLTSTDPVNGPLSKTTLNSPADAAGISANYTGANVATISYAATATGLSSAKVSSAVLTPGAAAQHLFVSNIQVQSNPEMGDVSVFDLSDPAATATTITGVYSPLCMVLDASGKLYVGSPGPDYGPGSISIFDTAHGNAVLAQITGEGLVLPDGMAVDAGGKLYVANGDSGNILIFDTLHGNAPLPPIYGVSNPAGVAVDANGKLYVASTTVSVSGVRLFSVDVFDTAHGNAALPPITGGELQAPYGMAIDKNGKLYVANQFENSVSVFDTAHGNAPLPPITGGGLATPESVAVDVNGKLYVTNEAANSVSVFDTAHGNMPLPAITGGGLHGPDAAAVR